MKIQWRLVSSCFGDVQNAEADESKLAQCTTEEQVYKFIRQCIREDFESRSHLDCFPVEQQRGLDKWAELRKQTES